jgi:hypothetical protein
MVSRMLGTGLYAVFAMGYLAAGIGVCLVRVGVLPDAAIALVQDVSEGVPNTLHVMQEFGTHLVALGIVTMWFARHYDQSRTFHLAMTIGWGLLALIHWFDVRGPIRSPVGPLINTIPFTLFAAVGLLRLRETGRRA